MLKSTVAISYPMSPQSDSEVELLRCSCITSMLLPVDPTTKCIYCLLMLVLVLVLCPAFCTSNPLLLALFSVSAFKTCLEFYVIECACSL